MHGAGGGLRAWPEQCPRATAADLAAPRRAGAGGSGGHPPLGLIEHSAHIFPNSLVGHAVSPSGPQ
ncbi:unnamed protein product [Prorocentrum cordatum]|uniref:Uncharacterized protein n=1 Tax=Prorocentrum cordatum TaxID=2364126 RepID=A0ABN9TCC1_9DINO|nr:unnamed protein product [Polarella glacialis]